MNTRELVQLHHQYQQKIKIFTNNLTEIEDHIRALRRDMQTAIQEIDRHSIELWQNDQGNPDQK